MYGKLYIYITVFPNPHLLKYLSLACPTATCYSRSWSWLPPRMLPLIINSHVSPQAAQLPLVSLFFVAPKSLLSLSTFVAPELTLSQNPWNIFFLLCVFIYIFTKSGLDCCPWFCPPCGPWVPFPPYSYTALRYEMAANSARCWSKLNKFPPGEILRGKVVAGSTAEKFGCIQAVLEATQQG
jgi:hypothetical protein